MNLPEFSNVIVLGVASMGEAVSPDIPWLRITLVLVLCVFLAFAAVGFLRIRYGMPFLPERFGNPIKASIAPTADKERLSIVERLPAGPSSQFVVLARGEHRYLIHVSQQGAQLIDQFAEDAAAKGDE